MTTYSPQLRIWEICSINLCQEPSGTGWPAGTRPWLCQPARDPMGCESPWGWHSPELLSVSPTASGCSQQLPRASSKWSRASQSLLAQRATGTRMAPRPRDTALASGSSWPCWSMSCQHSQAGGSLSEHPQRYLWGEGRFAAAGWTLSFSPWFSLCCSGCRLSGAPRSRRKSLRAAQPWGYAQMPVIYSSLQVTITKGAQQMPWGP